MLAILAAVLGVGGEDFSISSVFALLFAFSLIFYSSFFYDLHFSPSLGEDTQIDRQRLMFH